MVAEGKTSLNAPYGRLCGAWNAPEK